MVFSYFLKGLAKSLICLQFFYGTQQLGTSSCACCILLHLQGMLHRIFLQEVPFVGPGPAVPQIVQLMVLMYHATPALKSLSIFLCTAGFSCGGLYLHVFQIRQCLDQRGRSGFVMEHIQYLSGQYWTISPKRQVILLVQEETPVEPLHQHRRD